MTTEWSQCTIERPFLTECSRPRAHRHCCASFATHIPSAAGFRENIGIPRKSAAAPPPIGEKRPPPREAAGAWEKDRPESVTVTVAVTAGRGVGLLFRLVRAQRLGGEEHARDRRGVGDRRAGPLTRVEDALGDQVAELAGGGVEAVPG